MTEENEIAKLKEENVALSWELANQAQIVVFWEDKFTELSAENEALLEENTRLHEREPDPAVILDEQNRELRAENERLTKSVDHWKVQAINASGGGCI